MKLPKSVLSPAKINLMLRVLGRRADGYHNLQTSFELLDWGDTLHLKPTSTSDVVIEGDFGDLPQHNNLIDKAARLLEPFAKKPQGIKIEVEKKIPQGAGLGGGSSNAAVTLLILNRFWQCDLPIEVLMRLGLKLGADVPVFVFGKSAIATGVGEQLQAYDFGSRFYVLFMPDCMISTATVFSDPDLERGQQMVATEVVDDPAVWINDCLPVVLSRFPQMRSLYAQLSLTDEIYLSGTGSTLFAAFDSLQRAESCAERGRAFCSKVAVVKALKKNIL
ncbi:4-(cytidine 5'-diphospho)-2-C-methyl-D-erythritol kinase [Marinicella sp. W31]|uniref:4-(cytidine 5'-diphospho)-2-C-methyl-D-erythritol kinase n=1 Tax=Marinicella sp. W31 TaxID=3023713 RepID=UPI0037576955